MSGSVHPVRAHTLRRAVLAVAVAALAAGPAAIGASPALAAGPVAGAIHVDNTGHRAIDDLAPDSGVTFGVSAPDFTCSSDTAGTALPVILSGAMAESDVPTTDASQPVVFQAGILDRLVAISMQSWGHGSYGAAPATTSLLPGMAGTWLGPDFGTPVDLSALAAGTYTLAYLCSADITLMPAATTDGQPLEIGWSTLTVADGSWSLDTDPVSVATTTTLVESDASTHALTATVTAAGGPAPTGSVVFKDGGATVATQALTAGAGSASTASFTPTGLVAGSQHVYSAEYAGVDGVFDASTSATVTVDVPEAPPGARPTLVTVTATLGADGTGADLTATVTADGTTATDASGTVQFYRDGTTDADRIGSPVTTTAGVATRTVTGLAVGDHTFTAVYTPDSAAEGDYQASPMSAPSAGVTVSAPDDPDAPTALRDGDTGIRPGGSYEVSFEAGTFTPAGAVGVVLRSDPVTLTDGAAEADGSLAYRLTLPDDLEAGAHTLTFTDATDPTVVRVLAFSVAGAVDDPADGGVTPTNDPVRFLTDWVTTTAATPAGAAGLFAGLLLTAGLGVGAWLLLWRRRGALRDDAGA